MFYFLFCLWPSNIRNIHLLWTFSAEDLKKTLRRTMFALFRGSHNRLLIHHMDALFCLKITTSKYHVLRFSLLLAFEYWNPICIFSSLHSPLLRTLKMLEKALEAFLFCAQNLYFAHYMGSLFSPKTTTRRTYVLGFYLLLAFKLKIRLFSSLHISAVDFKTRNGRLMSAFFCASKSPTNTKVWLFPGSPENIYGYVTRLVSFLT